MVWSRGQWTKTEVLIDIKYCLASITLLDADQEEGKHQGARKHSCARLN